MSAERVRIAVQKLAHGAGLALPAYATAHAAGMDLLAAVPADTPIILPPGGRALVPTGIAIALPEGFEAQIRARSGLALRHGITIMNGVGTIDADYRGEVGVILFNGGEAAFMVERGMRIAQMVIARHAAALWDEVPALPESGRGAGGFGSTGTRG